MNRGREPHNNQTFQFSQQSSETGIVWIQWFVLELGLNKRYTNSLVCILTKQKYWIKKCNPIRGFSDPPSETHGKKTNPFELKARKNQTFEAHFDDEHETDKTATFEIRPVWIKNEFQYIDFRGLPVEAFVDDVSG